MHLPCVDTITPPSLKINQIIIHRFPFVNNNAFNIVNMLITVNLVRTDV